MSQAALREAAEVSKAWPFEEARKLIARVERTGQRRVLFETGYGPSGLPHIGTFGEVARTTMVRHAFRVLTDDEIETRLIAFSDDMDGLRKTPDNIPNRAMVEKHLGKPLTEVPDPFGEYDSFAAHNNARLRRFLDGFGFDYEFASSSEYYKSGRFDAALLHMLRRFEAVQAIMLPSLREERAATYSPFLPIHPHTRVVMQVPLLGFDAEKGTIRWRDPETDEEFETPVTGGHCKLQWKPDWAMRWYALGVDYEMAGKDLIDSVKLSSQIVRALGAEPPAGFNYELFLDEKGQKISKSQGQRPDHRRMADLRQPGEPVAVHVPEADGGQAALFRRHPAHRRRLPRLSRRLSRARNGRSGSAIPSGTSIPARRRRPRSSRTEARRRPRSPSPCCSTSPPSPTATTRRCCGASCAVTRRRRRRKTIRGSTSSSITRSPTSGISSRRRSATAWPTKSSAARSKRCRPSSPGFPREASAEDIQHALYDIARPIPRYQDMNAKGATPERPGVSNEFFNMIYAVLLGEERGPRLGSFIALYGIEETRALIAKALAGEFVAAA